MSKRNNWEDFKNILEQHHITTLYHFTDRDKLREHHQEWWSLFLEGL